MKVALAFVALITTVGLTACGAAVDEPVEGQGGTTEVNNYGSVTEQQIVLEDGRTVLCLIYDATRKAGLSCDWETAQ